MLSRTLGPRPQTRNRLFCSSNIIHGGRYQKRVSSSTYLFVFTNQIHNLAVILLSFILAVGFLMIILSCALWSNWLPLLVGEHFVLLALSTVSFKSVDRSFDVRDGATSKRAVLTLWRRRLLHRRLRKLRSCGPWSFHHSHDCRDWFRLSACPCPFRNHQAWGQCHVDRWWRVSCARIFRRWSLNAPSAD